MRNNSGVLAAKHAKDPHPIGIREKTASWVLAKQRYRLSNGRKINQTGEVVKR